MRLPTANPTVSRPSALRAGFTFVEVVMAAGVVVALLGILLPAIAMVRASVKKEAATNVVRQVSQAMAAYRTEDARHQYPPANADLSLSFRGIASPLPGPMGRLEATGMYHDGSQRRDAESRLLDPWGRPYRYSLVRPAPARPAGALADWNWDEAAARERAWGPRPDPATSAVADGPLLFAYVWSLGPAGDPDDATTWIYIPDRR